MFCSAKHAKTRGKPHFGLNLLPAKNQLSAPQNKSSFSCRPPRTWPRMKTRETPPCRARLLAGGGGGWCVLAALLAGWRALAKWKWHGVGGFWRPLVPLGGTCPPNLAPGREHDRKKAQFTIISRPLLCCYVAAVLLYRALATPRKRFYSTQPAPGF